MLKFVLTGLLLVPLAGYAGVFKCVSPEGKTSYSETPCTDGTVSRLSVEQSLPAPAGAPSSQEIIDRNLRAAEIMRGSPPSQPVPSSAQQQSFDPSTAVPVTAPAQPAEAPVRPARRGVYDPVLNRYLPVSGPGLVDPQTGKFFPPAAGGYVDSETGRFIPAP
ncbi:DUF4124 domain-containing protein [Pseudomonas aeruginosa]|uniref:DUF4124 domain-containing protein n=1 Tax=Pseudomonas aeruginosa TaxID=287 RepID=UPI003D6F568F